MTTRTKKSTRKPTARKATKKAAKQAAKTAAKRTVARKTARGLKVRMYRVGFGDFFLVTVPTSRGNQYILIDCGVFKGTSGTGDIGSIVEAVEDMYKTTKGKLALVIMTHRHADHIAGFSKADFSKFSASLVWMPYWEQFNADKAKKSNSKSFAANGSQNLAANGKQTMAAAGAQTADEEDENEAFNLQVDISSLAENLAMQFGSRDDEDAKEALAQLGNATGIEDFSAAATGAKKGGGGNAKALDLLKNHLGGDGKKVRYYAAGDEPELPDELKGLKATILGPPPKKAKAFLALTDLKKGVGQYLDSLTDGDDGRKPIEPFPQEWTASKEDYKPKDLENRQIKYDEAIFDEAVKAVQNAQPDMLAAAAAKIETFLNNQSLVVLFEFGGKKLLFAGDAQAGNWEYWLFKMSEPIKDPTKAGDIVEESKELLQTIDFYKVGHHGSTNATPIQAVETAVDRTKSSKGFVSMCSTEDGVYGNRGKGTEVPRDPLMKALADGSSLIRSDSFPISVTSPKKKTIKPARGVDTKLPKPKVGKLRKANLYIEYSF
jgi:beta-lactamase superfamily II metal-dependent hydrolase